MPERSKALRSGRSPLLWAWVRIPLLTTCFDITIYIHTQTYTISWLHWFYNRFVLVVRGENY